MKAGDRVHLVGLLGYMRIGAGLVCVGGEQGGAGFRDGGCEALSTGP